MPKLGSIQWHDFTNTFYVTYAKKCSIKCGVHQTPASRQIKMSRNIAHLYQFIPVWACGVKQEKKSSRNFLYKFWKDFSIFPRIWSDDQICWQWKWKLGRRNVGFPEGAEFPMEELSTQIINYQLSTVLVSLLLTLNIFNTLL